MMMTPLRVLSCDGLTIQHFIGWVNHTAYWQTLKNYFHDETKQKHGCRRTELYKRYQRLVFLLGRIVIPYRYGDAHGFWFPLMGIHDPIHRISDFTANFN